GSDADPPPTPWGPPPASASRCAWVPIPTCDSDAVGAVLEGAAQEVEGGGGGLVLDLDAIAREDAVLDHGAVGMGHRPVDETHGLVGARPGGAGDARDAERDVGREGAAGALGH